MSTENNSTTRLSPEEYDVLLRQMLNIGEALYCAGSEISRIEDSLRRLGKSYGAEHLNIYAITSSLVLTAEFPGMPALTQSRRIRKYDSMDLSKLEELNALCRRCSINPPRPKDLRAEVLKILSEEPYNIKVYIGTILAASSFAVFFGGNGFDALAAAAAAILINLFNRFVKPLCNGRLFYNVVVSFAASAFICILAAFIPVLHTDQIMIGDIMVLIPGIAVTNSIRYTLSGDSISGLEKLVSSLLQGSAIAAGFTLAIYFFRFVLAVI